MGVVALNLQATQNQVKTEYVITSSYNHLSLFAPGAGSYVKLDRGSSYENTKIQSGYYTSIKGVGGGGALLAIYQQNLLH